MHFTLERLPLRVQAGKPLNIVDGRGSSIHVLRGRVWITQEGSVDDVFLSAGRSHALVSDGKAIVSAEGPEQATAVVTFDAPLSVRSAQPVARIVERWLRRLRSLKWPRPSAA